MGIIAKKEGDVKWKSLRAGELFACTGRCRGVRGDT